MRAFKTMFITEFKIALRNMDGIIFGVLFPMGVVLLIGFIYGDKLAFEGAGYSMIQASFGALVSVGICATGLMGLPLVIADYRNKKILKGFKVTPVSPTKIILVQMTICVIISILSALGVFLVCKLAFGYVMLGSLFKFILTFLLVTISIYSIGGLIASLSPNIKMANLICTLVYFPMLFLSGATVPYEVLPSGVQKVSNVMPLTQGIKLLKGVSVGESMDNMMFPLMFMIVITFICIVISLKTFKWE
jgi:ABC-2 type transport system permease protein